MRKRASVLWILLFGCGDDGDAGSDASTSGADSSSTAPSETGEGVSTSTASDDDSSTADSASSGGSDTTEPCGVNTDCDDIEVCLDGACINAHIAEYNVEITSWMPADCGTINTPDLYFTITSDTETVVTSGPAPSCPGAWSSFCLPSLGAATVEFTLWDADVGGDDAIDTLCWPEPTNPEEPCSGGIDIGVLRAGEYDGPTLSGHAVISFRPGC